MGVQAYANVTNHPFILNQDALSKSSETLAQDGARATVLARYTLMSYNPATGFWVPFTDETATDGTQIPTGILQSEVSAAELVAGNVAGQPILVGNAEVDQNQLVIENSKTLATVVNVPTNLNKTVEELLRWVGIFMADTVSVEDFENA